ncbi:TPA: hypothetical protein H1005_00810 [archaeon]|uniref:Uncharacterized protein n=1 Tax=Candidatus Naiadarchaeum limnaeum TaxID=2756139 RepID=A0A832V1K7_9ARCH|nr:hypothetical protein [Candidatus Naiadarchaeales archaeon SRR2090153.bin1042]HIK00401.1 hypothetical protein [Candidatus Naiadarchaeum limnaeum]
MTLNYSDKNVVIDDFVGGKKGTQLIKELRAVGALMYVDSVQLTLDEIRRSIIEQIVNKQYGLMIFIESGGLLILGTTEIVSHARRTAVLPASSHVIDSYKEIETFLSLAKQIIKSSKRIAIVEGDVGEASHSYNRLKDLKNRIIGLNRKASVEIIVGVVARKFANRRLFNVIGVIVKNIDKLSDIVHEIRDVNYRSAPMRKLRALWKHRKRRKPTSFLQSVSGRP